MVVVVLCKSWIVYQHFIDNVKIMNGSMREKFDNLYLFLVLYFVGTQLNNLHLYILKHLSGSIICILKHLLFKTWQKVILKLVSNSMRDL